jgi:hypothetical protein
MEAGYVRNLVEGSPDRRATLEQMGINSSDFNRFLKMDKMYQLACSLDLSEDISSFLRNKEKFPFTTVERLYNTPDIRNILGLSDDFQQISDYETFKTIYKII